MFSNTPTSPVAADLRSDILPLQKLSSLVLNLSLQGELSILKHSTGIYPAGAASEAKEATRIVYHYTVEFDGGDDIASNEFQSGAELVSALARVEGVKSLQPGCIGPLMEATSQMVEGVEVAEIECHVQIDRERPSEELVRKFLVAMAVSEPISEFGLTSEPSRLPRMYEYVVRVRSNGERQGFLPVLTFDHLADGPEHSRLQDELRRMGILVRYHEPKVFRPPSALRLSHTDRRRRTCELECFEINLAEVARASSEMDIDEEVALLRFTILSCRKNGPDPIYG